MLAFRYRGMIIRTSAFKLLFLGVLTVSMVMFMRLQGLFVAMPVPEDKQSFRSVFPQQQHPRHHINSFPLSPDATHSVELKASIVERTPKLHVEFATSNLVLPSLQLEATETPINPETLRDFIYKSNTEERIQNIDKFPQSLGEEGMVIIVQVHNRPDYFSHLLRSLSRAKGIENALLVISHDYYNDFINKLVHAVDFCKTVQIFFPYSMQLYPNKFPGTDPKDCPRDATKEKAMEMGCINARHPDKYGHFREAKFTMTKHHWWWKANTVFDRLNITRDYNGPVVFLEEDHYTSPDFYHVLKLLYNTKMRDTGCNGGCDVLTLGTYVITQNYKSTGDNVVEILPWRSVRHNMGMAFDRETWKSIKGCMDLFCKYDDYNWDWTLMRISLTCAAKPFRALVMKAPRVFHIGECGVHHKKKRCNPQLAVQKFDSILNDNIDSLFPSSLKVHSKYAEPSPNGQPNGGWGDTRDHDLCLSFVKT